MGIVDLIVDDAVVVELKTVDRLAPVHDAQLLTYLRLRGWKWACRSTSMSRCCVTSFTGAFWGGKSCKHLQVQPEPQRRRDAETSSWASLG